MNPVPLVSVKVTNPSKKSDTRLFILRKAELQKLKTPENMKNLLLSQLGQEMVAKESCEMGVIIVCGCEMRMTFKKL